MLKFLKTLVCSSILCAGTAHLSGCGQSGPLYLPKDKPFASLPAQLHWDHGTLAIAAPGTA